MDTLKPRKTLLITYLTFAQVRANLMANYV